MIHWLPGQPPMVKVTFLGAHPTVFSRLHRALGAFASPLEVATERGVSLTQTVVRPPVPLALAFASYRGLLGLGLPPIDGEQLELLCAGTSLYVLLVGPENDASEIERALTSLARASLPGQAVSRATLIFVWLGDGKAPGHVAAALEQAWDAMPAAAPDEGVSGPRWLDLDAREPAVGPTLVKALGTTIALRGKAASRPWSGR